MTYVPIAPLPYCATGSCRRFAVSGKPRCALHERAYDRQRGTAHERGYTADWQRRSKAYLAEHPWCIECRKFGRWEAATVVDHKIPHKGNRHLFESVANWQALCAYHHNYKTATQDHGFGR